MASQTKKTKRIRKNKRVQSGKKRKRAIRKHGTTPAFPIHVDKAHPRKRGAGGRTAPGKPAGRTTSSARAGKEKASVARIPLKSVQAGSGKGTVVTETKSTAKPDPRSE